MRRFRVWWGLAMAAVAIAALGYLVVWNQAREERKLCAITIILDNRYQRLPPDADQDARDAAVAIHNLRHDLGCKERP